ncbi:MAG: hypothetical protein ACRCX5_05315 [Bacteroidales bacterium]
MEVKRVKIHSEEWLNANCEKIKIGGITHYRNDAGRIYLHSNMYYIFGNIIDIVIYSDKSMHVIDDNEWLIEDWMIEEYVDGCEYCSQEENKSISDNDNTLVEINANMLDITFTGNYKEELIILGESQTEINYCPMCGKKLKQ